MKRDVIRPRGAGPRSQIGETQLALGYVSGFTLVELSLTIFILGIVVITVAPRINEAMSADASGFARRLAATVRSCREQAIMTHRPFRIALDLTAHLYYVETVTDNEEDRIIFEQDTSVLHRPKSIPRGLTVLDVVNPVDGKGKQGTVYIHMLANGFFPGAILHLEDEDSQQYTVIFKPLTARMRYMEGYIEQEEVIRE